MKTAAEHGLSNCHVCGKLSDTNLSNCPRCSSNLFARKHNSIQHTLAYLLTACILYVPANVLPITTTTQFGDTLQSTIIGGVNYLWEDGEYPVAIIIFFASVLIPVIKILALFWLCWSVSRKHKHHRKERTLIYRTTEFIGRWSMLDVFVVAVMVALIQMGGIITIQPGIAALAFAGVVIITMFAAYSFDPRLIWDISDTEGLENARH